MSDFRTLKNATVTDAYPMEDVRETLDWLGNKKVVCLFDLKDGVYQVELEPESKACTAIRTVTVFFSTLVSLKDSRAPLEPSRGS